MVFVYLQESILLQEPDYVELSCFMKGKEKCGLCLQLTKGERLIINIGIHACPHIYIHIYMKTTFCVLCHFAL